MTTQSKRYNVVDGEPQLGQVIETTTTYNKEDIIDALANRFADEEVDQHSDFSLGDNDVVVTDVITPEEIATINRELNRLLDDDWGTDKPYTVAIDRLDLYISDKKTLDFDSEEYQ